LTDCLCKYNERAFDGKRRRTRQDVPDGFHFHFQKSGGKPSYNEILLVKQKINEELLLLNSTTVTGLMKRACYVRISSTGV
jgi:hypothetical protein